MSPCRLPFELPEAICSLFGYPVEAFVEAKKEEIAQPEEDEEVAMFRFVFGFFR